VVAAGSFHLSCSYLRGSRRRLEQRLHLAGCPNSWGHLYANTGIQKLKAHAKHLHAQHPDAAGSLLEGLEELFTINRLGVTGELARCLATTNVIESPNSVVRRVSRRVTNYRDVAKAMRWTAAGFLEAEKAFRRLRGH
jgi:transposase-like protein